MNDNLQKMRNIVCFAYEHSPFYKKLYDKNSINPNLVELPYGLPIVSQKDLLEFSDEFRTDLDIYKVCASSGTFDSPKLVYRTEKDYRISVLNQIKLMKWAGVSHKDTVAIAQTFGIQSYGDLTQEATRQMGGTALPIGMISDDVAFQLIKKLKATVLDVSPSRLKKLLNISKRLNADKELSLETIMVSGEKLPLSIVEEVNNRWKCKIYNQYGSEETDGLGGSQTNNGRLFLFHDSYIFELLEKQEQNDEIIGKLVVTSLYHKGTPLIRYDLGDILKFFKSDNSYMVLGRANENILIHDSITISPYQIDAVISSCTTNFNPIWQCIVTEKSDIVYIDVLFNNNTIKINSQKLLNNLSNCSIDIGSLTAKGDVVFRLDFKSNFENTGRKHKRFIDKRK